LKYYENLFIVNPNYEHDRLAYPIEKYNFGNYVLVQFETENPKLVRELEDWMKLAPEIMSNITVSLKKRPEVKTVGKES